MASKKKTSRKDNLVLIMKDMIETTMKKKCAAFFKEDVDEVAHGAPNYYQIIKHPMHLNIMLNKLKNHDYKTTREVFDDFMLIVSNCKTYNTDVNNLVRKTSIELEETVRKAWEKKAIELDQMGIDLNTATLDYNQVDNNTLQQKKMSKEEQNLRSSQGYAATQESIPPSYPQQYQTAQPTYPPQSLSQSTANYPQRARQPTPVNTAPSIQTNMSASQPLPVKQKMPRSPQNNSYQQQQQQQQTNQYSSYAQPSGGNPPPAMFKPSYRPSYNPNTSSSSNAYGNNAYNPEPAAGSGTSMKIDLGSLGLDFGIFNSKAESENNYNSTAQQGNNVYGGSQPAAETNFGNTYGDLNSTNMEKKDSFSFNFDPLDFPATDFGSDFAQPPQTTNGNGPAHVEPVKNPEPTPVASTNNFYNPPVASETKIDLKPPAVYEPPSTKMVVEEPKPKPEPVKPVVGQPPVVQQVKPKETVVEKPPQEKPKPKPVSNRNIWDTGDDDDDDFLKIKIPKKEASQSQETAKDAALKKIEPSPSIKMEIEKALKPAILNNKPKEGGDVSKTLMEQPKMEKKPSKTVVFEEFPEKSATQKPQEKNDDYAVHRSTSEKSTFNAPSLKQKAEVEKPKFKMSSEKTPGAGVTKRASEPPVETAPLNSENAMDHDQVLSGLLEDIQSSQNDLNDERSQENSNQSTFVKPKGDDEDSNRTPKGSSAKKINLLTKSAEKEKEKKPILSDEKPKISIHKPKPRIEEEEEEEEEDDDEEETYYSEPIQKKDRGEEEGNRIRFDLQAIKKDFEALKKAKVPKYIKKFQKNVKRLGKYFRDLEIRDEPLIKLKEEVEHLNLTDKSFNYSRILLYLFNVLVFCKYYYEINDQQVKKLRKFINVVRKSFFYIKEVVKLQNMKFDEEIETFDKSCREYRKAAHGYVKQQKNKSKEVDEESSSHQIRINPAEFASAMPSKITILEPKSDNKIAIKHPSLHHHPIKKEGALKLKLQNPAKKVPKVESLEPKEETEEDIIKKEMSKYLTEIRNEFEARGFQDNLDVSVVHSWKHVKEEVKKPLVEEEKSKDSQAEPKPIEEEKAAKEDAMEVENDNIFPVATSTISFSLAMPPAKGKQPAFQNQRRPAGSSTNRSIVFKMEDEKEETSSAPLWKPNPSLFMNDERVNVYTVNFIPNQHTIAESLVLATGRYSINKSAPLDQEIVATFFGNKSEEQGTTSSLVKRGVKCTTVSSATSNEFINKLAIIRIRLKQSVSASPQDDQRQNEINLALKHSMPIESFDKMQNIADERIKNEIKLKDYNALLPLANVKELMEENRFFDRILEKIRMDNWKFDHKLALFYNLTASQNDKFTQWDINLLTFIDNVNNFKLSVNGKTIL